MVMTKFSQDMNFVSTFSGTVTMPKEAVFTMKLEPELRDAFMREAQNSHRPASHTARLWPPAKR